jgi:ATP-dependent Clp protease ATP-binding subunit ClpC
MFERFTKTARQTVIHAQDEAEAAGHTVIGTLHMLTALTRSEQQVRELLADQGIDAAAVRSAAEDAGYPAEEGFSGQIPFTPHTKKALELALREALSRGSSEINELHVLLGLLRDECSASGFVAHMADAAQLREQAGEAAAERMESAKAARKAKLLERDRAIDQEAARRREHSTHVDELQAQIEQHLDDHGARVALAELVRLARRP